SRSVSRRPGGGPSRRSGTPRSPPTRPRPRRTPASRPSDAGRDRAGRRPDGRCTQDRLGGAACGSALPPNLSGGGRCEPPSFEGFAGKTVRSAGPGFLARERGEDVVGVRRRLHVPHHLLDVAVAVDDERRAVDPHVRPPHVLLLAPDAVLVRDGVIRIGEEGERQLVLPAELLVRGLVVG